jgi:hypothetical protein
MTFVLVFAFPNSTVMETIPNIIEAIEVAFRDTPLGEIGPFEAEAIDDYAGDEWRAKEREIDESRRWFEYSDFEIEKCVHALCHFDPAGWRHFIPAYMTWTLRHFSRTDLILVNYTIYSFDPCEHDPYLWPSKLQRFELLNQTQINAVCRFLRFMAAHPTIVDGEMAKLALDRYWERFCHDCANGRPGEVSVESC